MDSFATLKRRTTDLLQSLPQSMPAMPSIPASLGSPTFGSFNLRGHGQASSTTPPAAPPVIKGTWECLSTALPRLPRARASVSVVAGTAYVFGGDAKAEPTDNAVHAVVLPASGAGADYYAIPALAAKRPEEEDDDEGDGQEEGVVQMTDHDAAAPGDDDDDKKDLSDVPLSPPSAELASASLPAPPSSSTPAKKDKGKAVEVSSPPPPSSRLPDVPPPRAGHAAVAIGTRIFVFGGRAPSSSMGSAPSTTDRPLDEAGRVWVFATKTHSWTFLDPASAARPCPPGALPDVPAPRVFDSANASAAGTEKPDDFGARYGPNHDEAAGGDFGLGRPPRRANSWRDWAVGDSAVVGIPQRPLVGPLAEQATDPEAPWAGEGFGTLFVAGGTLADGSEATDCWAFDVRAKVWSRLPDLPTATTAPIPPRASMSPDEEEDDEDDAATAKPPVPDAAPPTTTTTTATSSGGGALAVARSRLYRFSPSGALDVLPLEVDTFDDGSGRPQEVAVRAHADGWRMVTPPFPAPLPVPGEGEGAAEVANPPPPPPQAMGPSPRRGAALVPLLGAGGREYLVLVSGRTPDGQPCADAWAFQVPPKHLSAASVGDALWSALGGRTGEGRWSRLRLGPFDDDVPEDVDGPLPRAYVAAAAVGAVEESALVLWGGEDERGRKLGDGWVLRLG